ncbi:hypothetical protein [Luteimonas sp. A501]
MATHNGLRILALTLGLGLAASASAQTIGYNTRTGDVWVDSRLGEINEYGRHHRDPFLDEMTGHYGAPRPLLVDLLEARGWAPGDVYYACAIAHALGVPCGNVVREYERNPGQGWGAVAKRMGIKPGSAAFHALKRGQVDTYGRWGQSIVVDRPVRVDWSRSGPGHARDGKDVRGNGQRNEHGRGNPGNGPKPGRGNGGNNGNNGNKGNGNGQGQGNNGNGQR